MTPVSDSLYLVLPVPFRAVGGKLLVEAQASNGLDRWADHFSHVTVAAPIIPEDEAANLPGFVWRELNTIENRARIEPQPLLWAYTPRAFLKAYPSTRRLMEETIARSAHLQFAIGGLVGDWAAIGALEAIALGRRYALHTDRVEHEVIRRTASSARPARRLKIAVEAPLMKIYHRHLIERCSLGLWHGDDCFRAYSPWARENHLVHDVHTRAAHLISETELAAKLQSIRTAETLEIIYAGRLDPMKDPLAWLAALGVAKSIGCHFNATWYGEGALLGRATERLHELHLENCVHFAPFVADREALLRSVRQAHLLVFTHVTPESPRILIEALVCGTAIAGYDTGYASDLLGGQGGGAIAPLSRPDSLGMEIARLAADRKRLAEVTTEAAQHGRRFTDADVFAHRSKLIKEFA